MKGESDQQQQLRRFELRVSVRDFLAARAGEATMLVTTSAEVQIDALEAMSRLLCKERVLHAITTVHGTSTLIAVDNLPAMWRCAAAVGGNMNMRKQAGPMPDFVVKELCCAMVVMALKMNGYVMMGDQGTYMLPKQTRSDMVQCVHFSEMHLVHDEVVAVFSPVVYHLNKADAAVHAIRSSAMGLPVSDASLTNQLLAHAAVFALPKMNHCRIMQYTTHPPPLASTTGEPQTEADFRKQWMDVHGITLPGDLGGYLRVQFPSGAVFTYPAACVATNWHILSKQSRSEANDITRLLMFEPKVATLLPASALLQATLRKRDEHQAPALTKRKKVY
ncbi:hypothetical protein SPRG_04132 [Saprolegnia parasitica CBS 223.65]|uniref:Uncharacterized protein n=1 Tax=Saprolegnia parasitica (strain CBS 223.65) TaxID=695850 RepID=A0A067CJL9_SAPPC|nr:hypothetical protein SPRG_04132 [Saprolegnia parasitica CBS 223.65]KDO30944.1 hypothetical protein SPRG_04132 [Saprolegnia parasitica CBS 223.65]|eukprot:XP_012198128.1 hypothetical protein SPRG_04132 [Saprolegnia parasitica CBS 223.65]